MLSPLIHNRLLRLMSYRQTPQNLSGFPLSKIDVEDIEIVLSSPLNQIRLDRVRLVSNKKANRRQEVS